MTSLSVRSGGFTLNTGRGACGLIGEKQVAGCPAVTSRRGTSPAYNPHEPLVTGRGDAV